MIRYFLVILIFLLSFNVVLAQEVLPNKRDIIANEVRGDTVKFIYNTNEVAPSRPGELLEKRTNNILFFGDRIQVYGGSPFFKVDDDWFYTAIATTTKDKFLEHTKLSFFEKLVSRAYADIIFAGAGDGYVEEYDTGTWDARHDDTSASAVDNGDNASVACGYNAGGGQWDIIRAFLPFNTYDLPDLPENEVATTTLYVWFLTGGSNYDNDGQDYVTVVEAFQFATDALQNDDYEDCGSDNGTAGRAFAIPEEGIDAGERMDYGDMVTGAYNSFVLNDTGNSWVIQDGWTLLGMREGHDAEDDQCTQADGYNSFLWQQADYVGTDHDPYLEIIMASSTGNGNGNGDGTSTPYVSYATTTDILAITFQTAINLLYFAILIGWFMYLLFTILPYIKL